MTPEALDWSSTRTVERTLSLEWFDGPVSGLMLLSNPIEEVAFAVIAEKSNPDGLDLRLAKVWSVAAGTINSIMNSAGVVTQGPLDHLVITDLGGHKWQQFVGATPSDTQVLIAITNGTRLIGAWSFKQPAGISLEEAKTILSALPNTD